MVDIDETLSFRERTLMFSPEHPLELRNRALSELLQGKGRH